MQVLRKLVISILFFLLLILITSCIPPTETPKGNLIGNIQLEGETDHSGIIVAVYDLAYLDTTIVRINNQYPQIGVHINQHTEFDHRLQSPTQTTETDLDGNFEIKKIPTSKYNVVAIKGSFGFKYLYNTQIDKDDNELEQEITLYGEEYFSGTIVEDWIFQTDHHYIIEDDTEFHPSSSLEIQPGAIIRINPGVDFTIHGNLTAHGEENNMFWVTSNDGFSQGKMLNTNNISEIAIYNSIELTSLASALNDLIEWGKWDWGNTCIINNINYLSIDNCIVKNATCGINNSGIELVLCNNNNIINIESETLGGIHYLNNSSGVVNHNIIKKSHIGIKLKNDCDPEVYNNYIIDCSLGLEILRSNSYVQHNIFENCDIGIRVAGPTSPLIRYNSIFYSDIGFEVNGYGSYYPNCLADIKFNNIEAQSYIFYLGTFTLDLYTDNNYYFTTNITLIDQKIFDKDEYPLGDQDRVGIVFYEPILNDIIENAGVQ